MITFNTYQSLGMHSHLNSVAKRLLIQEYANATCAGKHQPRKRLAGFAQVTGGQLFLNESAGLRAGLLLECMFLNASLTRRPVKAMADQKAA